MPQDVTTSVLRNTDLGDGNYLLEFELPEMSAVMKPAQFFMIGIPGAETLLRRPYSVCGLPGTFDDAAPGAMQVLYKVFGTGTRLLASLGRGAAITVLGPLGRPFTRPADAGATPVFVAGGIGSAPFPAWQAALRDHPQRPVMFYGARGVGELPLRDWFDAHTRLTVATDDGSAGRHGRVTEPLADYLREHDPGKLMLYACGPDPMLRAVRTLALEHGAPCELALEAHMACGFGVCLGCVIPVHDGEGGVRYDRCCVEGPVMRAEQVAW